MRRDLSVTERGAPSEETWVRTLGGHVGRLGQLVEGEARLRLGERCLLFLEPHADLHRITGMAQGLYRVRLGPDRVERLAPSARAPDLVGGEASALKRLGGRKLSDALRDIRAVTP